MEGRRSSARRAEPERSVVRELDHGRKYCHPVAESESEQHLQRPRRRRGADARGPFREQLGVALVEPDDRIYEVVGGEYFGAPPAAVEVDLVEYDILTIVGADVEVLAGEGARRGPAAEDGESLAQGRERLVSRKQVAGAHSHAKRGEHGLPIERAAVDVVDGLVGFGEQCAERIDVTSGDRRVEAGRVRRRGIRMHLTVRRERWRIGDRLRRLRNASDRHPRPLGEQRRALRLPELDRARLLGARPRASAPAARSAAASARRASAWMRSASVAAASSTAARANSTAAAYSPRSRERLGADAAPGDRRLQVVARERARSRG